MTSIMREVFGVWMKFFMRDALSLPCGENDFNSSAEFFTKVSVRNRRGGSFFASDLRILGRSRHSKAEGAVNGEDFTVHAAIQAPRLRLRRREASSLGTLGSAVSGEQAEEKDNGRQTRLIEPHKATALLRATQRPVLRKRRAGRSPRTCAGRPRPWSRKARAPRRPQTS